MEHGENGENTEARKNSSTKIGCYYKEVYDDAALIAAAQRVEHYEMAGYGAVRTYAKELGYKDAEKLLQQTLNEEGEADKLLTKRAEGGFLKTGINQEAKTSMGRL